MPRTSLILNFRSGTSEPVIDASALLLVITYHQVTICSYAFLSHKKKYYHHYFWSSLLNIPKKISEPALFCTIHFIQYLITNISGKCSFCYYNIRGPNSVKSEATKTGTQNDTVFNINAILNKAQILSKTYSGFIIRHLHYNSNEFKTPTL